MLPARIQTIPVEVLIEILKHLDYKQILRCTSVSLLSFPFFPYATWFFLLVAGCCYACILVPVPIRMCTIGYLHPRIESNFWQAGDPASALLRIRASMILFVFSTSLLTSFLGIGIRCSSFRISTIYSTRTLINSVFIRRFILNKIIQPWLSICRYLSHGLFIIVFYHIKWETNG